MGIAKQSEIALLFASLGLQRGGDSEVLPLRVWLEAAS